MIAADDSVRLLSKVLEGLDYRKLMQAYSRIGRPPVSPKILFKVIVYAYMNNIYSTRKIEQACKRDINFMWLLSGEKAPDHNTIARFRTERLTDVVGDLFYQLVNTLYELKEINFKNIFIDGTKIEASANRYSFVWKKATEKFEARLKAKTELFIEAINLSYGTTFNLDDGMGTIQIMKKMLAFLDKKKKRGRN